MNSPTKLTDSSAGTASNTIAAAAAKKVVTIPIALASLVDAATWKITLPFAFTVLSALFRTGTVVSTAAKAATLTLSTTTGAVTGGVMALTSANQAATGGTVAATAISGAGATAAAGEDVILTVSSVTAFVEGDGVVEVTVRDESLAAFEAAVAAKVNSLIGNQRELIG